MTKALTIERLRHSVKKPGGKGFRLVVDLREVNKRSIATAWPMPNMEAVANQLQGSKFFFSLDAFKGFWLMGLHEECQEMFSFMTDEAVYTPTRSFQGGLNSALQFQARMCKIYQDMPDEFLKVWIDDFLGHAETNAQLLERLERVFQRAEEYGVKFSAVKSILFSMQIRWCGKIFDGKGVSHDPQRVEALTAMREPQTALDLQQFLWSVNWMRTHLPDFANVVSPLQDVMDQANEEMKQMGKSKLPSGLKLLDVGWDEKSVMIYYLKNKTNAHSPCTFGLSEGGHDSNHISGRE